MAKHVFSKMAADVTYHRWEQGGDIQKPVQSVTIKGGAGVADRRLVTPLGVHTEVTDEEYEILKNDGIFKLHLEKGAVTVENRNADPDKVAANMATDADPSSPLTPSDYEETEAEKKAGIKKRGPKPKGVKK